LSYRLIRTAGWHRRWIVLARIALATPLAFAAAHEAAAQWKPEGAIELIATNAPGGGSDRILRLMRNGQVRIIAIAAPQRLPGDLVDVPTWREQGYDAVVPQWRGFIGPRGLTAPVFARCWTRTTSNSPASSTSLAS
jgi:tripartite-type tricarboxylate transporter receptor subunit TctC